tara:strand:+ start:39 stop:1313 length:1275 start_codon:yes stop_codon:yes gene_type:complete
MRKLIDKFFLRSNNLNHISLGIIDLAKNTPINKIFKAINSFSTESEIRYVGGCLRKIINKEKVDDIDLATNLEPKKICEALKKNNIDYYESGIEHGTITALLDKHKFEITSLRRDIFTDGRHAKVEFSSNWKDDASRRDFTINCIYCDQNGNLFDPYNGKKDLENGVIKFIGDSDKRIKEDYLRILRYIRFFLIYSKKAHDLNLVKKLKINIDGIKKLSKERLLDELKKIIKFDLLRKLQKDKLSFELVSLIFPELKKINFLSKIDQNINDILKKNDFIFLVSLMIIDGTDNPDYFLYKFNISKNDQARIKVIDNFYKETINSKTFTENNINKVFYYKGKDSVIDILNYGLITFKKKTNIINELKKLYENKTIPTMPVNAEMLMSKYDIPKGKQIGLKLRLIEEEWVNNGFKISNQKIDNLIKN